MNVLLSARGSQKPDKQINELEKQEKRKKEYMKILQSLFVYPTKISPSARGEKVKQTMSYKQGRAIVVNAEFVIFVTIAHNSE